MRTTNHESGFGQEIIKDIRFDSKHI